MSTLRASPKCSSGIQQFTGTCYFNAVLNAILLSPRMYTVSRSLIKEYHLIMTNIQQEDEDGYQQLVKALQGIDDQYCLNDVAMNWMITRLEKTSPNTDENRYTLEVARMSFARFLLAHEKHTSQIDNSQLKKFIQQTSAVHRNIPIDNISKIHVDSGLAYYALKALLLTIYGTQYKEKVRVLEYPISLLFPCKNFDADIVIIKERYFKDCSIEDLLIALYDILVILKQLHQNADDNEKNDIEKAFNTVLSADKTRFKLEIQKLHKMLDLLRPERFHRNQYLINRVSAFPALQVMNFRDLKSFNHFFEQQITMKHLEKGSLDTFIENVKQIYKDNLQKEIIQSDYHIDSVPTFNVYLENIKEDCNELLTDFELDHVTLSLATPNGGHAVVGVKCGGTYMVVDSNNPEVPFVHQNQNSTWFTGYTKDIQDFYKKFYGDVTHIMYNYLCYVRKPKKQLNLPPLDRTLPKNR